jgi:hypothetical protein
MRFLPEANIRNAGGRVEVSGCVVSSTSVVARAETPHLGVSTQVLWYGRARLSVGVSR